MTKKPAIYLLLTLTAALLFNSCSINNNKMPITSSSTKAIKNYQKGIELADKFKSAEATKYFKKAIALDSNFAMAYLRLATVLESQKDQLTTFEKAISLKNQVSKSEQLWLEAVQARSFENDFSTFRKNLSKISEMYPNDVRPLYELGNSYYGQQDYVKAIEYYNAIIDIDPDFTPTYNMLGYTYRNLKNYNEAEKMFDKYIELIPNDPNPYDSYAELLMKTGRFDKSIENYKKALEIDPYFFHSHLGIASNLNLKGDHIEARNQLQEFFRTAKNNSSKRIALEGMAISYVDEGDFELAQKIYHKKYDFDLSNNDTILMIGDLNSIGVLNYENGNLDSALSYFKKSKELLQSSIVPHSLKDNNLNFFNYRLALIQKLNGDNEKSEKNAELFYDFANSSDNPAIKRFVHQLSGLLAYHDADYQKADIELRQANQESPYNLYYLGLIHEQQGEKDKALSFFDKAANANDVNSFLYSIIRLKALAKQKELSPSI